MSRIHGVCSVEGCGKVGWLVRGMCPGHVNRMKKGQPMDRPIRHWEHQEPYMVAEQRGTAPTNRTGPELRLIPKNVKPMLERAAEYERLAIDERWTLQQVGDKYGVTRQAVSDMLRRAHIWKKRLASGGWVMNPGDEPAKPKDPVSYLPKPSRKKMDNVEVSEAHG